MDKMDKKKLDFLAEFTNGYTFRSLIEFLNCTLKSASFIFTKYKITLAEADPAGRILHQVEINTDNIGKYKFCLEDNESSTFGFDFKHLKEITGDIGKKEGIRIFKYKDEPQKIHFQKMRKSNNLSNGSVSIETIISKDLHIHDFKPPVYSNYPNFTFSSSGFSENCKSMAGIGGSYILCTGYPKGMVLSAEAGSKVLNKKVVIGKCSGSDTLEEEYFDPMSFKDELQEIDAEPENALVAVRVKHNIVKALTKIFSISDTTSTNLSFFFDQELPIKIQTTIGNYGSLNIFLRDYEAETS